MPDARAACDALHKVALETQIAEPAAWAAQLQKAANEESIRRAAIERAIRTGQDPPHRFWRQSEVETAARVNKWLKSEKRVEWGILWDEEQDLSHDHDDPMGDESAGLPSMNRNQRRIMGHIRIDPDVGPGVNHFVTEAPSLTLGLVVAALLDHEGHSIKTSRTNIAGRVGVLNAEEMSSDLLTEARLQMDRVDAPVSRDADPELSRLARIRQEVRAAADDEIRTYRDHEPASLRRRILESLRSQWVQYSPSWVRGVLDSDTRAHAPSDGKSRLDVLGPDATPRDARVPLSDLERRLLETLVDLPPELGLLEKQLVARIPGTEVGSLRTRQVGGLRKRGWELKNRRNCGYYLTEADRERYSTIFKPRDGEC
ncbi:hypothetical protein [Planctomycetes bacterium Poly30]|uniref:hypothetical protein n=1 Tax=Saltatorellus ferox TaxID=2528018 RepID=UPI0011A7B5A8